MFPSFHPGGQNLYALLAGKMFKATLQLPSQSLALTSIFESAVTVYSTYTCTYGRSGVTLVY